MPPRPTVTKRKSSRVAEPAPAAAAAADAESQHLGSNGSRSSKRPKLAKTDEETDDSEEPDVPTTANDLRLHFLDMQTHPWSGEQYSAAKLTSRILFNAILRLKINTSFMTPYVASMDHPATFNVLVAACNHYRIPPLAPPGWRRGADANKDILAWRWGESVTPLEINPGVFDASNVAGGTISVVSSSAAASYASSSSTTDHQARTTVQQQQQRRPGPGRPCAAGSEASQRADPRKVVDELAEFYSQVPEAGSTGAGRKASFKSFMAYCDFINLPHNDRLPPRDNVVRGWISYMAGVKKRLYKGICNAVSLFSVWCQQRGLIDSPLVLNPRIKEVLEGVKRDPQASSSEDSRRPLTIDDLRVIARSTGPAAERSEEDILMLAVMFAGCCGVLRLGELLGSNFKPPLPLGRIRAFDSVNRPVSRDSPRAARYQFELNCKGLHGESRMVHVTAADAIEVLRDYFKLRGNDPDDSSAFLRSNGRQLTLKLFNSQVREYITQAGLPEPERVSSHSLRKGGAQSLLDRGADISDLMIAGGWKDTGSLIKYVKSSIHIRSRTGAMFDTPLPTAITTPIPTSPSPTPSSALGAGCVSTAARARNRAKAAAAAAEEEEEEGKALR